MVYSDQQYLKYLRYEQSMPYQSKYTTMFSYSRDLPALNPPFLIITNQPRN